MALVKNGFSRNKLRGLLAVNKKAGFNHEITSKFKAGIKLRGYEVKAIKEGGANFEGAYINLINNKPVLINLHIGKYSKQSQKISPSEQTRTRELLLKMSEIEKIRRELQNKGKTAIPLALILNKNLIKLELGIAKGRKKVDKRNLEKKKQIEKDLQKDTKDIRLYLDM